MGNYTHYSVGLLFVVAASRGLRVQLQGVEGEELMAVAISNLFFGPDSS